MGALALPAGIFGGLAAETAPMRLPAAAPSAFDVVTYVADLRAAGCEVYLSRTVAPGGEFRPWTYGVASVDGLGEPFDEVEMRWWPAIAACPDYRERVVAHLQSDGGVAA